MDERLSPDDRVVFLGLTQRYYEGGLTEEELERFNEALRASAELRDLFIDYSQTCAAVQEALEVRSRGGAEDMPGLTVVGAGNPDEPDILETLKAIDASASGQATELPNLQDIIAGYKKEEATKEDSEPHPPIRLSDVGYGLGLVVHRALRTRAAAISGVAALLLLALLLFVPPNNQPPVANNLQDPVASRNGLLITGQTDAVWRKNGEVVALSARDRLKPGQRFTLARGLAELTTPMGAVALLEAPCTIEALEGNNSLYLHDGKAVGLCHTPASKGFTVSTRHGDIVDLGTEFGVHAQPNRLTTTVFTGEVELTTPGGTPQPITTNQTARLSVNGNNRELAVEDQLASGFDRLIRPALVSRASINLEGFEVRVVPRGVREDAQLFTDRKHEINGLDANGIPRVLRRGDLVMMPGDARPNITPGTAGLELELDLAQPSDIYILMPEEAKPLAWLERDYEQTALRVGHDRGEGTAKETPAVGSGNSIDNDFIVWKRSVDRPGTVTAGYGINFTMYAVIVVPKDEGGLTQQ